MKVAFGINEHDSDGDVYDTCIKLYCNDTTIIKFEDLDELMRFGSKILEMRKEIQENLNERY